MRDNVLDVYDAGGGKNVSPKHARGKNKFFDQDGSGAIDTKELGTIMRQLGAKLTDSEINLLVQEADVDGDGQVDINEVCMCVGIRVSFVSLLGQTPWRVEKSTIRRHPQLSMALRCWLHAELLDRKMSCRFLVFFGTPSDGAVSVFLLP